MANLESDVLITVSELTEIIDTDLGEAQLNAVINVAHHTVDQLSSSITADVLADIELYLAAHLVTLRDRRVESESIGDASFDYQGDAGMGLEASNFGQMALTLDTSGKLAQLQSSNQEFSFNVFSEADL